MSGIRARPRRLSGRPLADPARGLVPNSRAVGLKFPAYRRYKAARVAASDSLMALLIGARLGEHALSASPADSGAHLPQLFGRIEGIERVNRTVADAAQLLRDAEHHLASMGIPYVLGVQGAFLSEAIAMLREDGKDDEPASWSISWRQDPNDVPLNEIHEYVAERCGRSLPIELLELFHLARRIRNRIIHFAGDAGSRLPGEYRSLSREAKARWEEVTGRPLTIDADGRLELSEGELVAVLATTHRLAQAVNEMLVKTLSREYWARVIIIDYRTLEPQRFGEKAKRMRRLIGHARIYYGAIGVTSDELQASLDAEI
jgi:hypothetical protein